MQVSELNNLLAEAEQHENRAAAIFAMLPVPTANQADLAYAQLRQAEDKRALYRRVTQGKWQ